MNREELIQLKYNQRNWVWFDKKWHSVMVEDGITYFDGEAIDDKWVYVKKEIGIPINNRWELLDL